MGRLNSEQIREECVRQRRFICGRVLQIVPDGVVVDSGYTNLLSPPYNQTWVSPGNISVQRNPNAVETTSPDSVCVGLVFLTDIPKRPPVQKNDYVVIHGYPAGQYAYSPFPDIHKVIRRFSCGLERAVTLNQQAGVKTPP